MKDENVSFVQYILSRPQLTPSLSGENSDQAFQVNTGIVEVQADIGAFR